MIQINSQAFVTSINISAGGIPKLPVEEVYISEAGLQGDGHNHAKHYRPTQAVSLQDIETLTELRNEGYAVDEGATGENVNVYNLFVNDLPIGTRLMFSGGVEIEITRMRPPCYVLDSIDPQLKTDIIGRCGAYAKVICPGRLKNGETICVVKPDINVHERATVKAA